MVVGADDIARVAAVVKDVGRWNKEDSLRQLPHELVAADSGDSLLAVVGSGDSLLVVVAAVG